MKRFLVSLLLVALFIPVVPDAASAARKGARVVRGAPLPARRGVLLKGLLPEGLRLLIWYDPDLEVETTCLAVGVGAQHDMERKQGAAALVADVIQNGHSGLPAAELARAWEERGLPLEVRSDEDASTFLLSLPPGDFKDGLTAFGQLISQCEVREEDVHRELQRAAHRYLDRRPWSDADVELRRELFSSFAYHRAPHGTPGTLANVTQDICRGYYSQYYRPNNSVLVATGPVPPEEVRTAATRAFARWTYGYVPPASPNEPPPLDGPVVGTAPAVEGVCVVLGGAVVPHLGLQDRMAVELCADALTFAGADSAGRALPAARRGGLRRHRLCDEVRLSWTTSEPAVRASVRHWLEDLEACASGGARENFERLREACLDRLLSDANWTAEAARATLFGWPVDTPDEVSRAGTDLSPAQVSPAARRWLGSGRWGLVSTARRGELEPVLARGAGAGYASPPDGER
jgi:hypothetical protein